MEMDASLDTAESCKEGGKDDDEMTPRGKWDKTRRGGLLICSSWSGDERLFYFIENNRPVRFEIRPNNNPKHGKVAGRRTFRKT